MLALFMFTEAKVYKEKIVDAITGDEIFRDYSKNEIAEVEANLVEMKEREEEIAGKLTQRKAILERLGITEEEAKLLLS
jgi:phosphopantetheine adenylyltransferase